MFSLSVIASDFVRWSPPHLAVVIFVVLLATAILWGGCRASEGTRHRICRVLAVVLALQFVSEFSWRAISDDYGPWRENLPLHFCSVMIVIAGIALWWRKQWACALVYFGVLTASVQGLITPALKFDYPTIPFFIFFASHGLLFIVALSIPVLLRWRARRNDVLRSMLLMDAYLLFIIPVNVLLGTNYCFTQGSPVTGSMLDYLGPAPWYYLLLQIPACIVFYLMSLPVREKSTER